MQVKVDKFRKFFFFKKQHHFLGNIIYVVQAIPLSRQPHLLELVISRLQDKSSIVRKNAIQLLKTCLICNPFGAQVSP